ncbi:MAG: sulfatase-like hydrolase/transferase [Roseburia sp.]|nr:sulfatase-like hydrolase/transferase [Roseburia sp.]
MKDIKTIAKKTGANILRFIKTNYLMVGYIIAAFLTELTGIAVTAGKFYMTEPWLYITFVALICFVSLYLPGHTPRYILFTVALAANFILDIAFIIIFDSTNTVFDYAMISLRNDAMMIVESVPVSFTFVFVSGVIMALYCTLGYKLKSRMPKPETTRLAVSITTSLLSLSIMTNGLLVYFTNYKHDSNDLSYKLYQTETSTYSNKGIIGNFYNELARGLWFSEIDISDLRELKSFVYADLTAPTPLTGKATDYNVVTVLCESFEWFTFLYDADRYPNGYAKLLTGNERTSADEIKAKLHMLYPNLYRFYESDSTVILNNSHALEKTDISENKSIIGNYPMYEYINYAYPENSLPYSIPNILNALYGVESNSFHNGYKTFYNRNIHHTHALGFNSFTSAEDMDFDDDDTGLGERNLDSQMFDSCKEAMFPTDRRFNTFVTTITQHGQYAYRENLQEYYDRMDALGILPYAESGSDSDDRNALRFYCAAGMDFDKAIGIMLDYLEANGLADKTLITLFGDHNVYYQGVSNYVKNIISTSAENYTELYRTPVMIKIGNASVPNGMRQIEKFTCIADIYPTILDLLGITTFSNLTYGVSAFSEQSSVLYSRAYDKFLTDKIYFNSMSNINYKAADADDAYIEEIRRKALVLLDKISHVNRLFASDYFNGREEEFYSRLREVNREGLPAAS